MRAVSVCPITLTDTIVASRPMMKTTTRISISVKPAVRRIVSPDVSTSSELGNSCGSNIRIPAGLGAGKSRRRLVVGRFSDRSRNVPFTICAAPKMTHYPAASSSNQLAHPGERPQNRQHDERDHPPHEYDHHGLQQRRQRRDRAVDLSLISLGRLEQHLLELAALFADGDHVDHQRREDAALLERGSDRLTLANGIAGDLGGIV